MQERRLRQYADILLCFCMDFTAMRATDITKYRYRLMFDVYTRFREVLAGQTLSQQDIDDLKDTVLYGLSMHQGRILISALSKRTGNPGDTYPALISQGKLQRVSQHDDRAFGKLERFWSWSQERLRLYHRITPEKLGLYLKEREWKYNYRYLTPESQAVLISSLVTPDILKSWSAK